MLFSLIIPTKGRVAEVERLFQSFTAQTLQDFEIILSDQNEDDRLAPLLQATNWGDRLIHLKSTGGVSCARNMGLDRARGEFVCFPDDDCSYPAQLLEQVHHFFTTHPAYGFLSGRSMAEDGGDAATRHATTASDIQREKIYSQCIEFAFFIRRSVLVDLRFDENMGVGALTPWHSDEGPDLMLRMIAQGIKGYYEPHYAVWHPRPTAIYDAKAIDRSYRYACGSGYFLRKHGFPLKFLARQNLRTLCGFGLACATLHGGKALFYLARIRGRWRGWNGFKPDSPGST